MHYYDSSREQNYKPLNDYGVIGNLETCALVGADGSIDWLCLPHLESSSIFGKLLDYEKGGVLWLRPKGAFVSHQSYVERTNVLQTFFRDADSETVMTDFMPPFKKRGIWHKHQILFRRLECGRGVGKFVLDFQPRFNFGRTEAKLKLTDSGVMAESKTEKIFLDCANRPEIKAQAARIELNLKEREETFLILQYNSHASFNARECRKALRNTIKFWRGWAHYCQGESCIFRGPWHGLVVRSGLVLKLLTHGETGSIAAAATTSLPEIIGGVRNWDYRFNWIRDSVFTAQALYNLGHIKESRQLFNWYKKIYKGVKLQDATIMNGLHGDKRVPETVLKHWSGYKNSAPVRVGNKAAKQRQLDIYGELLNMAYEAFSFGDGISKRDWALLKKIVNHVGKVWQKKDAGIWEIRKGYRHYVYSKIMCWVAVDRGIKIALKKGFPAPLEKWQKLRDALRQIILKKGYDEKMNSFVQAFNSKDLDAANLLIPLVGFLPIQDSRVQGTITATIQNLTRDGLVYRYRNYDGLPGAEGGFVLCTNWLIDILALSGRLVEAEKLYGDLLNCSSPLGLFAEELNLKTKEQLGNFPQAYSHIGLINSALYIGLSRGYYKKDIRAVSSVEHMALIKNKFQSVFKLLTNE